LFVGIDIAATRFSASWQAPASAPSASLTLLQSTAGYASLQAQLAASGVTPAATLVVLEATGSYWITLATCLHQAGYAVSVINPAQAHHFAKALLQHAKSDPLDAQLLAQLAARLQPEPWTPPPAIYDELQQRLAQRDSLIEIRQQLRNQLHALQQQPVVIAPVQVRIERLLLTLDEQIAEVEREIAPVLQQDATWAQAAKRLQSISGIGLLSACWLLVSTLAFTTCATPEQAAAYAGLVPYVQRSGTSVRRRASLRRTGHARLRTALYMASVSATRHNPLIRAFYQRLRRAGKPPKVARCAAARKLMHLAWAVVTRDQDFDPNYAQRAPELPASA
jgi:transposase